MATFTIRNDSEIYTSSVTSITFTNHPFIFHRANLSNIGGNSNETSNNVTLPSPYTLSPLSSVNIDVIYDLNNLTPGTYQGIMTLSVQLESGFTQLLTATNNITIVSATGAAQYVETAYNTTFVYSAGAFADGFGILGPISANSAGDPSGSLPGNFE